MPAPVKTRRFAVAAALLSAALIACAPEASETTQTPAAAPAPAAVEGTRLIAAFSTACRSETQFACGATGGCRENEGAAQEPPVSFAFDGPQGAGRLCIVLDGQEICRAVAVNAIPGETPVAGEALTGLIMSEIPQDDATAPPAHLFDGLVTLGADGAAFRLVQANPDVAVVWSGSCAPTAPASGSIGGG